MMILELEHLLKMERKVHDANSHNPRDVMEYMGFIPMAVIGGVPGFIAKRKNLLFYGINDNLKGIKNDFATFHEGFHYICGHLDMPGFLSGGFHADTDSLLGKRIISSTERDANIGAADQVIDTEEILDMLGYDNQDVIAYRKDLETFETHVREYRNHFEYVSGIDAPEKRIRRMEAYQHDLAGMYTELQEQAQDIANSGICFSIEEIAHEYSVPEYIISLKIKALEIRNYNVSTVELPTFDRVFSKW